MSETVTLELPDSVVRQARAVAAQTQRPVEAVCDVLFCADTTATE